MRAMRKRVFEDDVARRTTGFLNPLNGQDRHVPAGRRRRIATMV
jgi:hypothetical protein